MQNDDGESVFVTISLRYFSYSYFLVICSQLQLLLVIIVCSSFVMVTVVFQYTE